jgi:hypothetical protein
MYILCKYFRPSQILDEINNTYRVKRSSLFCRNLNDKEKYRKLARSTRRCPGHYIKIIKCIVRAKVARKVSPKVLQSQGQV